EADLQLDPVLDDLTVLDLGGRLHDLDGADVPDRAGRGGDGLTGGVAPRSGARPDHLADDVHAHSALLQGTAEAVRAAALAWATSARRRCEGDSLRRRRGNHEAGHEGRPQVAIEARLDRGHRRLGSHLVEARAAVHRSIVARRERHHRLAPAHAADRGMVFARPARRAGTFGCGPTARAALRIVLQAFAREERLFPRREEELLAAIPAAQSAVLVHARRTLHRTDAVSLESDPSGPVGTVTARRRVVRARFEPARGPELIARRIRAASRAFREIWVAGASALPSVRPWHPRSGRRPPPGRSASGASGT